MILKTLSAFSYWCVKIVLIDLDNCFFVIDFVLRIGKLLEEISFYH